MPRIWFTSDDGSRLVQLQQDRLIFNWRDTGKSLPYPRFKAIKVEFERVSQLFQAYVEKATGEKIRPVSYNLTYVNIIKQGDGWQTFNDVGDVFPDLKWRADSRHLPLPTEVSWKATFLLPNDFGSLTAHIQTAKKVLDNLPVLKFELSSNSGSLGGRSIDFSDWTESAHNSIINSFKDLTDEEMHRNTWFLESEVE